MTKTMARPAKCLLVGAGGYVVNLLAFAGFLEVGVPHVAGSVLAYMISNVLMYLGNRYFTFRMGHVGFWSTLVRYFMVGLVVAALVAAILALLIELAGLHPLAGQAVALLIVTPLAFVLFKRYTFRVD